MDTDSQTRMLYDFHQNENSKKPSSVNATYVLTGVPKPTEPAANGAAVNGNSNDDDDLMPSSPYISSSMPNQDDAIDQVSVSSVLLAREEDLQGKFWHAMRMGFLAVGPTLMRFADAKAIFESISSIYVYSLQPAVLQDLNVLTDVSREMLANHAQEDPLEYGKQWGMIQNTNVKVWTSQQYLKQAMSH